MNMDVDVQEQLIMEIKEKNMADAFEQFAIVELFGHQVIAGKVTEQIIGGQGFVRVDVPALDSQEAFTKFYGAGAIYAITPCDEKTMNAAVQGLHKKPIELWTINVPQLPSRNDEDEDDDDNDFNEDRE